MIRVRTRPNACHYPIEGQKELGHGITINNSMQSPGGSVIQNPRGRSESLNYNLMHINKQWDSGINRNHIFPRAPQNSFTRFPWAVGKSNCGRLTEMCIWTTESDGVVLMGEAMSVTMHICLVMKGGWQNLSNLFFSAWSMFPFKRTIHTNSECHNRLISVQWFTLYFKINTWSIYQTISTVLSIINSFNQ